MKKHLISLSLLFISLTLFAQSDTPTTDKQWGFSMGMGIQYTKSNANLLIESGPSSIYTNNDNFTIGNFTPAIFWKKGKRTQEVEITRFQIKLKDDTKYFQDNGNNVYIPISGAGNRQRSSSIGLRYANYFNLLSSNKITFDLGASVLPYFEYEKTIPTASNAIYQKDINVGAIISAIPRINFLLGKRLLLRVDAPLDVTELVWNHNEISDPTFTNDVNKNSSMSFDIFPIQYQLRVALALKI